MYEHYSKEEAQKRSYKEPHSMSPCHQSDDSLQIISNENITAFKKFFSAICTNPDGGEKIALVKLGELAVTAPANVASYVLMILKFLIQNQKMT